jgi:type IV pilus assembly protein PilM
MKNDKKLRNKNVVALDIGTKSIKIAYGKYQNEKIVIKKMNSIKTPKKCISNGRIVHKDELVNAIKPVINEMKLKNKFSVVTIKSSSIINRELKLPYNEDQEALTQIVNYEMKQFFTIKLDQYVTQYQIIEEMFEEKSKMIKVMVTSIEKEIVESYLELIKEVGLKPYVFDVHFNVIGKMFWLQNKVEPLDKTVAIIDIGFNSTDITIVKNDQFKMSRTVDTGTNTLQAMLKEEYSIHLSSDETINFTEEILNRSRMILDNLLEEVNNVTRFFISRDSKNVIDSIYLTGGLVNHKVLTDLVFASLKKEKYEFENTDKFIVGYEGDDLSSYIALFGSFIRK